jgi:vacuolar-type H+-ATPase subunit H
MGSLKVEIEEAKDRLIKDAEYEASRAAAKAEAEAAKLAEEQVEEEVDEALDISSLLDYDE